MNETSFLEHVAKDLLSKHGTDLSRMAVVFPNKRAALFMNEFLARNAEKPVWSPTYMVGDSCCSPTLTMWTRIWLTPNGCSAT